MSLLVVSATSLDAGTRVTVLRAGAAAGRRLPAQAAGAFEAIGHADR